jgi:hypothetical protein
MSTRAGLIGHVDRYLAALATNDVCGLALAPTVRFSENGQELTLGRGLSATASGVPDHDYAHVVDEGRSQIGWIGAVDEHGTPSCVFVRLAGRDGLIVEVETVVRRPHERLYNPSAMREPRAIVFAEIPAEQRCDAAALVRAGNGYFDGLEQADASVMPVTDDCTRYENGTRTVHVTDTSKLSGASRLVFPMGVREQVETGYFS